MRPDWLFIGIFALGTASSAAVAAPPRFASPFLSYASGFDTRAVAIADVNGDTRLDVLIVSATGLEVRLGAGDGTLGPPASFGSGTGSLLVLGDLDGDGALDVVTEGDSLHVGVLRGNGDGSFASPVLHAVAKGPVSAVLVDLDRDGDLDLVCAASKANVISVLPGDGTGGFGPRTDIAAGLAPWAVATADLDHDADADIVVANRQSSDLTRLLGDGTGQLTPSGSIALPNAPSGLVLSDLDGDGWQDAVASSSMAMSFMVVPGSTGGGFSVPFSQAVPDYTAGIAVANLDPDAFPDVIVLDWYEHRGEVLRGGPGFTFATPQPFNTARDARGLAVGDLNGGGKLDLVTGCAYGPLAVHMGNGDGTFGGVSDLATGPLPWTVACADLDADGQDDIVTSNIGNATLSLRFGLGAGGFTAPVELATATEPHGITIADLDADGDLDLLVAENGPGTQSESSVAVFLGDGARGFAPRQAYAVGRWSEQVAVGDLNGDAYPDLAVACNDFVATLTLLAGQPGGTFADRQDLLLGSNAGSVAIADVTRDGLPDVLLAARSTNQAFVLPRAGGGGFGPVQTMGVPGASSIAAGDVAGDGAPDLVVSGTSGIAVFASTMGGGFDPRVDHGGGAGPLLLVDLDQDGRLDVATANGWPSNAVSVWFGQSGGGLGPATAYGGGDRPFSVASGDINEDGLADLLCANLEANSVSVLLNTGGALWLPWLGAPPPVTSAGLRLAARPNPAHGPGVIEYSLPHTAPVCLRLFDVTGRELARLDEGEQLAGPHVRRWDPSGLPAGVCFLELRAGTERSVRRVVVLP